MRELQIFKNAEFGQIRTTEIDGKPYFVAKDIASSLGYSNPRDAISRHCKGVVKHDNFKEGGHEISLIPEGDIYRLIVKSQLPNAEKFEAWVFDEVLPSIRKTGGYIAGQETMSDTELMAKALLVAQRQIEERNQQIERMRPKEIFADAVSASQSSILVRDLAKMIKQNGVEIGEKRLYAWMRKHGFICQKPSTMPTQRAMEMGLFEIHVRTIECGNGLPQEKKTTIEVPAEEISVSKEEKTNSNNETIPTTLDIPNNTSVERKVRFV